MAKYHVSYTKRYHCEVCGTLFISNKSTARHCSNACKQVAYRKRKEAEKEAKKLQLPLF